MVVENLDKGPKGEFQSSSSSEKSCRYCKSSIPIQASVCHYCGRHQIRFFNYFRIDHIGLIITAGLLILAYSQFNEARKERAEATEALKRAYHAEEMVSKLEKSVKQADDALSNIQSITDFGFLLAKASNNDRSAFDRLVEITQESGPFQDLADRAIARIILTPQNLPKNRPLENKLKEFGYTELVKFYHEFPSNNASVLVAVDKSTRLTDEERFDFLVAMIDKDESLVVVERACLYIKPLLEEFRQIKPGAYHRAINKCKVYGRLWRD